MSTHSQSKKALSRCHCIVTCLSVFYFI